FSSRRRHTRFSRDWSSDVCSSDLFTYAGAPLGGFAFGDVPVGAFHTDGAQTILPGASAFYRHTFVAGSAGTVRFSAAATANPAKIGRASCRESAERLGLTVAQNKT